MTTPENTERRLLASYVVDESTGCWRWIRPLTRVGYGRFFNHGYQPAHRVMYERLRALIPEGLTIDHLCRNRACVNPDHMEPVPIAENIRRGISPSAINGRKTHCVNGHPLSGDNLLNSTLQRFCKTCRRDAYHAKKAVA